LNPTEILQHWSSACREVNLGWYLYRETLLCAEGYGYFPEELKTVQVAVFSKDLDILLSEAAKHLPPTWTINTEAFITGTGTIHITCGAATVICIDVLHPYQSEQSFASFVDQAEKIRKTARLRAESFPYIQAVIRVQKIWTPIKKLLYKKITAQLQTFLTLMKSSGAEPAFFSDHLTAKQAFCYQNTKQSEKTDILADGVRYPVLAGYREYLAATYGDYKVGLYDDFGCGLSAEDKAELAEHQKKCIALLAFLKELCEKHGLQYCLVAGNVLGAVRHGGFIPWDDDIDIGVKVENIARFEEIVKNNLPAGYDFVESGPNNPYPRLFSKICYNGRCCMDIWPFVPTYKSGLRAKFIWYFGKVIAKVHYIKIGHPVIRNRRLPAVLAFFLSDKAVMKLVRWNERLNSRDNPSHYINLYSVYSREKETVPTLWLDEPGEMEFAGIRIPVVGHTEEYLTHLYGNYMAKPAPWNRGSRHVARFFPGKPQQLSSKK